MRHGYTIFWDVLWGILLYLVGLGLYLVLDLRPVPIPGIPPRTLPGKRPLPGDSLREGR
jgi:hypothetical protein